MKRFLTLLILFCGVASGQVPLQSPPLLPAQTQTRSLHLGGLSLLLGALPPADLRALDGLGSAYCPPPTNRLDRVLYDALQGQGPDLSCGNQFEDLLEFPGPSDAAHPQGSFNELARRIRSAKSSVLLANMVWDQGRNTPGQLVAAALADLRRNVLAHPQEYPQGMSVRILLGNSVRPDRPLDARTNLDYAVNDLLRAGLNLSGQAQGGWQLSAANFRYAAPHSHLKLLVLDGQEVITGGYNISTEHLTKAAGGEGLSDLGIIFRGPVARNAVAAFRDSWQNSDALTCPATTRAGTALSVRRACHLGGETASWPLLWPAAQSAGQANVYSLYRRSGLTAADQALISLLGAAQTHLDLLQSQVSGDLTCDLSLGAPGGCLLNKDGLPVWQAVAAAMRRGVRVRLALDQAYPMKFEAAALVRSLQGALAGSGAEQNLEVRWVKHPMHTKAILIDGAMAVVGSTNLHFSSFGPGGLSEYALATSDKAAVAQVQDVFKREWSAAVPFTYPAWAQGFNNQSAPHLFFKQDR